jgi:hypothetical protein
MRAAGSPGGAGAGRVLLNCIRKCIHFAPSGNPDGPETNPHHGTLRPMGHLSTHVLDTAHGCPAAGMAVTLQRLDGPQAQTIKTLALNADGRADGPLLDAAAMAAGPLPAAVRGGAVLPRPRRGAARAAVHRHRATRLRHRRRRRPLPRATARQPLELQHLPRQLTARGLGGQRLHRWKPTFSTGPTCCCAGRTSSWPSPGSARRSTSSSSTTA